MCAWALDPRHLCVTRNEWVLMESMRRLASLVYFIDLLFQTHAQSPSSGECPDFVRMPLPCVRELWQPISDRDWKKQYQTEAEAIKQKGWHGLTYRDLLLFKCSSTNDGNMNASSEPTEELADWCERADDFSMILWMALSLEGDGQMQYL